MNESLNQSLTFKKVSKKIKKVKVKYINFCIFLLIVNFFAFFAQKFDEFNKAKKKKIWDIIDKKIMTKNIFLLLEDFGLKILIIISLIKFKVNAIILFSILYFIIASVMIFYLTFNQLSDKIIDDHKIKGYPFPLFIINIVLFSLEGFLLAKIYQLMTKEQRAKSKEKYGFNSGDETLRDKNILVETSFSN